MPTETATPRASGMEYDARTGVTPSILKCDTKMPANAPKIPPRNEMTVDSIRNWVRMTRLRAPIAFRMPISRVRSVTVTSMMFITPIAPTRSDTAATQPKSAVKVLELDVAVESRLAESITVKGRLATVVSLRDASVLSTSLSANDNVAGVLPWTSNSENDADSPVSWSCTAV